MTRDTWIGVALLGFAVLYWVGADGIRVSPLDGPVGADGLPKALAFALGALAVMLVVHSFAVTRTVAPKTPSAPPESTDSQQEEDASKSRHITVPMQRHLRALGMLGLGVGYLLIVPYLGYVVSIMGLLLAVALYIGAKLGPKTLAIAGIGGVFFYLLFVQFLNIPLPPGIWPGLLRSLQG